MRHTDSHKTIFAILLDKGIGFALSFHVPLQKIKDL